MGDQRDGGISWTDQTWNPTRGCSRVSPGCVNCYAESVAARFSGKDPKGKPLAYYGLARQGDHGPRWTGKVVMVPEHMDDPIRWKRPRKIFVNSMSDLFHERLTNDQIASVFLVMLNAPRHTFQILTKRSNRMRLWVDWFAKERGEHLPAHIWLGVSAENQETADERLPDLYETAAQVLFVSAEPLLGPIDISRWLGRRGNRIGISWVIIGGESGAEARPFDVEWMRSLVRQCRAAGIAPFDKQLGAKVYDSTGQWRIPAHVPLHGPEIETWAADFAVREFPSLAT